MPKSWLEDILKGVPKEQPKEPEPPKTETVQEAEAETLDHDPDGCDECLEAEALEEECIHQAEEERSRPQEPEEKDWHQRLSSMQRYEVVEKRDERVLRRSEKETLVEIPEWIFEAPPAEPPRRRYEARIETKAAKAFFAQIGALADEVRVVVDYDGWHVKSVDPAHVAMIDVTLPYKALDPRFEWSRLPEPDDPKAAEYGLVPLELGLDVDKMKEVLKSVKDETFRFSYDESTDKVRVETSAMERVMPALDTSGMTDPKVPNFSLPRDVRFEGRFLADAVKGASSISDHIRFVIEDGPENRGAKFVALAEGDLDKFRVELPYDLWLDGRKFGERATSLFPLDYLSNMLKGIKGYELTLKLGTDYPLRVEWDDLTKGIYLLAPRIEASE